jgi:hypothetical protein
MARTKSKSDEAPAGPTFAELVHQDGRTETPATALRDAQLRWAGWLPKEQVKLPAPDPSDSGSSGLTGNENTEGTA